MKNYTVNFQGVKTTVLLDGFEIKAYSKVPEAIVEEVAKFYNYLYKEKCMHTGKQLYKIGRLTNRNGGVINLLTTTSLSAFNKFIIKGQK